MADPTIALLGGVAVLILLAASAFFSATEIATFSLPAGWLAETARGDDPRARALSALRADPHRLLVTLLVGNTLVNVALSAVVTIGVASVLPPGQAAIAATVVAASLVLVFGEILPKSFGLGHAGEWALTAARPLAHLAVVLAPAVLFFDLVTRRLGALVGGSAEIEQPYTD